MTLDDVYGSDHDRFPLEQDAEGWDATLDCDFDADDLGLAWDGDEVARIAAQLRAPRGLHA